MSVAGTAEGGSNIRALIMWTFENKYFLTDNFMV